MNNHEQLLNTILETTHSIIYIFDLQTNQIIYVNNLVEELLGYSPKEIYSFDNEIIKQIFHEKDIENVTSLIEKIKNNSPQKIFKNNFRILSKSGDYKWFECNTQIYKYNNQNEPIQVLGNALDITHYINNEKALKISEEKFRNLAENSTSIIYRILLNPSFHFDYVSPAATSIVGYTPEEHYADPLLGFKLVHPDDIKILEDSTKYTNGEPVCLRWIRKDGKVIWTEQRNILIFDENNQPYAIEGSARDITDTKLAEIKLKEEKDKLKKAFSISSLALGISSLDEGRYIEVNNGFCQLTGFSASEVIGKTSTELNLWTNSHSRSEIATQLAQQKIVKNIEIQLRRKDNSIATCLWSGEIVNINNREHIMASALDITAQRLFEKQLIEYKQNIIENEERLRLSLKSANQGLYDLNIQTGETITNDQYALMLGYEPSNFVENHDAWQERLHEDDKTYVYKAYNDYINNKTQEYKVEFRQRTKDNKWIWILSLGKIVSYDSAGKPLRLLGTHTDITKYKQIEFELIEAKNRAEASEQHFEALINNAPDSVVINDWNGVIKYASPNALRQFGYEENDIIGQNGTRFVHQDDIAIPMKAFNTIIKNPEQKIIATYRFQKKNGEYRWIETTFTNLLTNNSINGFVLNFTDVTERKQILEELIKAKVKAEESEFKIRGMFENTHSGILYFTTAGNIIEANNAVIKILGSPSLEVTKQINLLTFQPLIDVGFSDNIKKCINEKIVIDSDAVYTSKWSKTVYMKYFLIPIISNNRVIGVWANLHNLTDLWNTQNELIKAKEKAEESDRLKSAFLRNISHEVRTPMNAISGFTDILCKDTTEKTKRQQYADIIHKSVNQLLTVVENMITIAFIETNQLQIKNVQFAPADLINDLFAEYLWIKNKTDKNDILLKIENSIPAELKIVSDYTHLQQILRILLDNSIKFTKKGCIKLGLTKNENNLNFFVADTGIGIPKEKQEVILKSFTQADDTVRQLFGGMGLGLSIAVGLIKLLGGQLIINSEENKGTLIKFSIPVPISFTTIPKQIENTKVEYNWQSKTILIAEDEDFNFTYIEELLEETNIKILRAFNGLEAVKMFNNSVDIILMDLKMPQMSGFEAATEIRKINNSIPIIAQTAFYYEKEDCMNALFTDYITKPFTNVQLFAVLQKYIH